VAFGGQSERRAAAGEAGAANGGEATALEHPHAQQRSLGSMSDVLTKLRAFVTATYLRRRKRPLADDEPLLSSGIVDSLGLVELIAYLEEEFGILVSPDEFGADRIETVRRIAELVAARAPGR